MRNAPRYPTFAVLALAGACVLSGCATAPEADVRENNQFRKLNPRVQRERVMQAAWRGQSYYSLLEKLGPPRTVMTHPGLRADRGEIVLYGVRDASSNCIDAFTVAGPMRGPDRTVVDYFCR